MPARSISSAVPRDWLSITKALLVRFLLSFHVVMCTWRVVVDLKNPMYWWLICGLFPFICECCYTIIRRQGVEFSRFTPCFFYYLAAVFPAIWLLELEQTDIYINGTENQKANLTNSSGGIPNTGELNKNTVDVRRHPEAEQGISLRPETWLLVIEEMLPYALFFSRWILPRGRVRREELAELLFAFIEIAADIMEFLSLVGESMVRSNKILTYCVLGIWSLSVLQFTTTVTAIHQPKKERKAQTVVKESKKSEKKKEWERNQYQCYAIFLTIIMQDLPYAVMRLYTIIKYHYINYSLIFFTSKNIIIISLLLYKVVALCKQRHCPEEDTAVEVNKEMAGMELGGSEKCQRKSGSSCGSLSITSNSIEKTDITEDGSYTQSIQWFPDEELGLKKRCPKPDIHDTEPPSNGHVKHPIIDQRNDIPAAIIAKESAWDSTEGIAKDSSELCKDLSPHSDQGYLPDNESFTQDNVPTAPIEAANKSSMESEENELSHPSEQEAVIMKDFGEVNNSNITIGVKEANINVSVLQILSPSSSGVA